MAGKKSPLKKKKKKKKRTLLVGMAVNPWHVHLGWRWCVLLIGASLGFLSHSFLWLSFLLFFFSFLFFSSSILPSPTFLLSGCVRKQRKQETERMCWCIPSFDLFSAIVIVLFFFSFFVLFF
jgi:hypothetical protein